MIVALTGFMACGKSTFGRALADRLGWAFADLDDLVSPGRSAGEALREMGVDAFRTQESEALSGILSTKEDVILALGGGTVLSESNRKMLASGAKVIWLKTSLDIILSELSNADRPLAKGLSAEEVESLLHSREPSYEAAADAVLTIETKNIDKVTADLEQIIKTL